MAQEITLTGQEIYNLTHWLESTHPETARKIKPLVKYAENAPNTNFKIVVYKEENK